MPQRHHAATAAIAAHRAMNRNKILVVEDNVYVRRLFEISLGTDFPMLGIAVLRKLKLVT